MADERRGAVTFKGNPVTLSGTEVRAGQPAPSFAAVDVSLQPVKLADGHGKVVILSSVPSLDTPVCDAQTKRFNEAAAGLPGVEIYTVSMDLPFAQARWHQAENVSHRSLSAHRSEQFGRDYGVLLKEWRLLQRAVFVVDKNDKVLHVEYVDDQMMEPDYEASLEAARKAADRS